MVDIFAYLSLLIGDSVNKRILATIFKLGVICFMMVYFDVKKVGN